MKKTFFAVICTASLLLSSCGAGTTSSSTTSTAATPTTSSTASTATSLLSSVLSSVLGGTTVSQETLVGNWTYAGSACKFESENLLMQAGGDIAASQIEAKLDEYLGKIGIKSGVLTMNFTSNNTCAITVKNTPISNGTYVYDATTKKVTINSTLGLVNINAYVGFSNGKLCVLFDADKLLTVVNAIAAKLGTTSSTVNTVSALLGDVKGMKVGFSLSKV